MIEIFGWVGIFAVGFVLGLLGGGGSILIVPVLVYLFHQTAQSSTAMSLFVVGLSSAIGLFVSKQHTQVHWGSVVAFAIPSSIGAFLARQFFVPVTPDPILGMSKDMFLLVAFALLMLIVGVRMLMPSSKNLKEEPLKEKSSVSATPIGFAVGTLAGYLGAGGGFLIVPALNQILRVSMVVAIPTSLAIISAQSLVGFTGTLSNSTTDWMFALKLTAVCVVGTLAGSQFKKSIAPEKLKPIFGVFVRVIALFMLGKELIFPT
jgi:uncharacterized membrane protein YfcA